MQLQADAVEFVGALAAEILLRGKSEWAAGNLAFDLSAPSEAFQEGMAHLGIPDTALTEEGSA